jgi:hypothetical protein
VLVQVHAGVDEMAVKRQLVQHHEFKCLHFELEAQAVEAAAENTPLKEALVKARAAAAGGEGYTVPPELAKQLLDRRCIAEEGQGWKVEWARRQSSLAALKAAHEVCP